MTQHKQGEGQRMKIGLPHLHKWGIWTLTWPVSASLNYEKGVGSTIHKLEQRLCDCGKKQRRRVRL